MCKICSQKPVYEFTNKHKLCEKCFLKWFRKKFLYTIRKFQMTKKGDVIYYKKTSTFRDAVLEDVLRLYETKAPVRVFEMSSLCSEINNKNVNKKGVDNKQIINKFVNVKRSNKRKILTESNLKQVNLKIAVSSTTDSEANEIINNLIKNKPSKLKQSAPINKNVIRPLYLFLDKEVLLYAKLNKLKFQQLKIQKDKISYFINELEKKHPELKSAILSSYLKIN